MALAIYDFDGTLVDVSHLQASLHAGLHNTPEHIAKMLVSPAYKPVVALLKADRDAGHECVIVTNRAASTHEGNVEWMREHLGFEVRVAYARPDPETPRDEGANEKVATLLALEAEYSLQVVRVVDDGPRHVAAYAQAGYTVTVAPGILDWPEPRRAPLYDLAHLDWSLAGSLSQAPHS